jgi:hypothetical protein
MFKEFFLAQSTVWTMPTNIPFIIEASSTYFVALQKELQSIFNKKEIAMSFLSFFYIPNNIQIREPKN